MSLTENEPAAAPAAAPQADTAVSPPAHTPAELAVSPSAPAQADKASSPDASKGPTSGVDAVLAAIGGKTEAPPEKPDAKAGETAESKPGQSETTEGQTEEGKVDDLSEADLARLNFKTRQRIIDLTAKGREAAGQVEELRAELDRMKPDVEGYQQIKTWMREHDLSSQDAAQAMQLAGLINKDPEQAYRQLYPILQNLAKQAGYMLDPDLAEEVKLGRITKAHAQEIARSRAKAALSERQAEAARKREEEAQAQVKRAEEERKFAAHVQTISQLGDKLTAEYAQRDPDWKQKEPLVVREIERTILRDGVPKDAADLQARFVAAVDYVTNYLRGVVPAQPKAVKPPMSASSPASKLPPPKDGTEAVLRALG